MSIKVRVKPGYMVFYGTTRRYGERNGIPADEFYIKNEKEFSERAMEKIESRPGPVPVAVKELSEMD